MTELDSAHDDGFDGEVTVHVDDQRITVHASMRGYFEPVDGRYHWYGRLAADDALTEVVGHGKTTAQVSTAHGSAQCLLSDVDPWGRLRITGTSTPPFPIARTLEDVEAGGTSVSGR